MTSIFPSGSKYNWQWAGIISGVTYFLSWFTIVGWPF